LRVSTGSRWAAVSFLAGSGDQPGKLVGQRVACIGCCYSTGMQKLIACWLYAPTGISIGAGVRTKRKGMSLTGNQKAFARYLADLWGRPEALGEMRGLFPVGDA